LFQLDLTLKMKSIFNSIKSGLYEHLYVELCMQLSFKHAGLQKNSQ